MNENIFLPPILFLSILIVYEDIKGGKIPNRYLFFLLIISLVKLLFSSIINLRTLLFSVFVSLFLWLIGFWPSGDAKLFIIYSIFLSSEIALGIFEINVFLPFFLFYTPFLFWKVGKKVIINEVKKMFSFYNLYILFSVFFGFLWLVTLITAFFNLNIPTLGYFLIVILMIEIISRFAPFSLEVFYGILCLIRIFVEESIFTLNFWLDFLKLLGVYILIVKLPLSVTKNINIKEKKIEELKVGDVLAEGIILKNGRYVKESIPLSFTVFFKNFIHSVSDDGLTKKDVRLLKKLKKEGKIKFKTIKVYEPVPFALFLFIGFLLTFFIKGSCISLIRNYFWIKE